MRNKIEAWLVLIATIATITVNGLANALPINNQTTGEISDSFTVFFVPAGYVFSIWGLIYIGLIAFSIYQLLPAQIGNTRLMRARPLYLLASIANISWLLCWHYNLFGWSMLAMIGLLLSVIAIYLNLDVGRGDASRGEKWLAHLPFSIYLGWISVATIANATVVLTYYDWSGWGISPEIWTLIMLLAGAALAFLINYTRGDVTYSLVLLWAYTGIAVKHAGGPVSQMAWGASVLVVIVSAAGWLLHRRLPRYATSDREAGTHPLT
jgi:hypothetical protein